tara:strand:+ start:448 stop:1608 length:1161 start_codon:yes stop_codon:yes gene_type:complete
MSEHVGANVVLRYVNGNGGVDSDTGANPVASGRGSGDGPWKTLQHAFNEIAGSNDPNDGDVLVIMKTGNDSKWYGLSGPAQASGGLTFDPASKEVMIVGADALGNVDGTVVEIHGGSLDNNTPMILMSNDGTDNMQFHNLIFDGGNTAKHCIESDIRYQHNIQWHNCQFKGACGDGINFAGGNTSCYWNYINCRFNNNGGAGITGNATEFAMYYGCLFDNNNTDGAHIGASARIAECIFYNNGDDGADINTSGLVMTNCIVANNGDEGIVLSGGSHGLITNTIFSNNGQYHISNGSNSEIRIMNCTFTGTAGNTFAYESGNKYLTVFNSDLDTGPTFADLTNFDFTPSYEFGGNTIGTPLPYRMFGSTAGSVGLNKWIGTEVTSIF